MNLINYIIDIIVDIVQNDTMSNGISPLLKTIQKSVYFINTLAIDQSKIINTTGTLRTGQTGDAIIRTLVTILLADIIKLVLFGTERALIAFGLCQ